VTWYPKRCSRWTRDWERPGARPLVVICVHSSTCAFIVARAHARPGRNQATSLGKLFRIGANFSHQTPGCRLADAWHRGPQRDDMLVGAHARLNALFELADLLLRRRQFLAAPLYRGARTSNHDRACDRRDAWVGPSVLTGMDYERAYGWKSNTSHESEMALFSECMLPCARKVLDTANIVRDAC